MRKYFYTTFVCTMFLLLNALHVFAQQRQITGVVADQQGITLPGVTVKLKGTTVSAITDVKGEFKMSVPAGNNTLVFSFIGLQTLEIAAGPDQTKLQVTMQSASRDLNEVVVVGYGSTKKRDVTGSVGSIKGSDLNRTPSANVDQLLQGKIPGVQVMVPSGQPGAAATIRVRGIGSRANANALVVIDGIPLGDATDIKQVNPDDIESIEVLKDASSSAIYGSRGANGVLLITTKKGKAGQARINFTSLTTLSTLGNKLDVFHDPVDVAVLSNESRINGGEAPQYVGKEIGGFYYPSIAELRGLDPTKSKWPYNTDWAKLVYRNPLSQSYTLSADGGSDKTIYSISGNYYNEQGLAIKNGYEKYSGRINLEQKLKPNVTAGINVISTWTKNSGQGLSVDRNIIFPALNDDGTYFHIGSNDYGNPLQMANEVLNQSKTIDVLSSAFVSWDIIKGLNLRSRISNAYGNSISDNYQPRDATGTGYQFQGFGQLNNYSSNHLIVENFLTYDRDLTEKHHINFVAGTSYENTTVRTSFIQGQGFVNDILNNENLAGAKTYVVGNNLIRTVLESYYGRFNYSFLNRYLFTFTGRMDGSSKFGDNNKYAFFPTGAVAWKVNEESFMKSIPQVSELKIRGSYGLVGNQGVGPYQSLSLLGSYKYYTDDAFQTGYGPPFYNDGSNVNGKVFNGLGNKSLKWETTRQLDIGIDLGLFDQRFTLSADYYYKHTTDLLRENQIALSSGYSVIQINDGVIDNKGFELGVNAQILRGKLNWNVGGNISINRNKVLNIGGGNSIEPAQGAIEAIRAPLNYYINGQPAQVFVGYMFDGIVQQGETGTSPVDGTALKAGDIKYLAGGPLPVGQNGTYIIGNPNPKFTYSFNTSLKYDRFDLSAQFYGVYGNDIFNFSKFTPSAQLQRWTPDNPTNLYPSVNSTRVNYASTWYVQDGSFLRIQNVNLGYNFKPNFVKGISNLRVYFSGNNLYTFTKFNASFDPEVGENGQFGGNYRKPRAYSLGVNVSF